MKSPGLFNVNKRLYNGMCAGFCALAAAGCGSNGQDPQVTTVASTDGGVSGGPLTDTLTVYAVDADSGQPMAGAYVSLGSGQSARKVGQTGGDGKLVISGLDGSPQMISVNAAGYAAASWGLVKSAVARIPLESMAAPPADTTISLSVPGWNDLPALPAGSYRIARFAFSRPRGLEALEAALDSAAPDCTQTQTATDCTATLNVPADATAVLAVIAEGTDAGTPDDTSDDTLTVTALGIETGLSLHEALSMALSLQLMDRTSLAQATLVTPAAGVGVNAFEDVIGVPGISLDGQILLYPSLGAHSTSFLVPTASGPFVNAKLWAVGTANNGTDAAWSRVYERGIDPPRSSSDAIDLATTTFSDSPALTKTGPSSYMLTGDGNLERLEIATPSGQRLNVLLFPTQTEFEIPAGLLSEEPTSIAVESFDLEVDLSSFDFADLARVSTRIAYARNDAL
jgi:hypothetical protein